MHYSAALIWLIAWIFGYRCMCVAILLQCVLQLCCSVCCSVLQCVAVCCGVLQSVTEGCSVLQCITVHCSSTDLTHSVDLQIWARACCNCVALHGSTLLCVAVLYCVALLCSALQCRTDTTHSVDVQMWVSVYCRCVEVCCSVVNVQRRLHIYILMSTYLHVSIYISIHSPMHTCSHLQMRSTSIAL